MGPGYHWVVSRIAAMVLATESLQQSICAGFLDSVERWPLRPALEYDGAVLTYAELFERAAAVAGALGRAEKEPPLAAVFAHRSITAYVGVLGTLLAGRGYVPLNRTFPPLRTQTMLARSGARALVVDEASAEQLDAVLAGFDPLLVVMPDCDDVSELRARWRQHHVLGARDLGDAALSGASVGAGDIAYLLFTSGSTGQPKGVGVTHANVKHFLDTVCDRYGVHERDRLTQTFDLTFDPSVFDMFVAWSRGACLCAMPEHAFLRPDRYLDRSRPTVWFGVPSLAMLMQRLGMLRPDRYPTLRWSLFCGEALPVAVVDEWWRSAPNSTVENLYGPTELTITCTVYGWDGERGPAEAEQGVVPIGDPLRGMEAVVVDANLHEVEEGMLGELLMTGPQRAPGYWNDPARTATAFVEVPGRPGVWYRTGDLVRRPADGAPLVYLGRLDHQVKVRGFRVELGEVEAVLRETSGHPEAVVIGWPLSDTGPTGLVGFLIGPVDERAILNRIAKRLPHYMVPDALHSLPELPANASGKVDRDALAKLLDAQ